MVFLLWFSLYLAPVNAFGSPPPGIPTSPCWTQTLPLTQLDLVVFNRFDIKKLNHKSYRWIWFKGPKGEDLIVGQMIDYTPKATYNQYHNWVIQKVTELYADYSDFLAGSISITLDSDSKKISNLDITDIGNGMFRGEYDPGCIHFRRFIETLGLAGNDKFISDPEINVLWGHPRKPRTSHLKNGDWIAEIVDQF